MMKAAKLFLEVVNSEWELIFNAVQTRNHESALAVAGLTTGDRFAPALQSALAESVNSPGILSQIKSIRDLRAKLVSTASRYLVPYRSETSPQRPSIAFPESEVDIVSFELRQQLHDFGLMIGTDSITTWSKFRSPDEWEWVFEFLGEQCSWKTIGRKNLRKNPDGTTKRISFDISQLPTGYDDTLSRPKSRVKSP